MDVTRRAEELLRKVLDHPPAGLLTDIDGTLSRISGHPQDAVVEPEVQDALRSLTDRFAVIAAITGRSAEDARRIVALDELVYSGNHGMELWRSGSLERSPLAERYAPVIRRVIDSFQEQSSIHGLYVEDKVLTASIHYRGAEDPNTAREEILSLLSGVTEEDGLVISEGRMVVELRPPVELNKGTSSLDLIKEYNLSGGLFLGDDVTDVDAFIALRSLRESTGKPFFAIGVASQETPALVSENADALVDGVDGVIELLRAGHG